MNRRPAQVVAPPSPRLRPWRRMIEPGWIDWVPRHHYALPVCRLPVCVSCESHIVGKNTKIVSGFFFPPLHKQHNYSTTTAWFTGWNLFCSALKGRLLFLSLSQLKPENVQFPTITVVSKVNIWIFCWDAQERTKTCVPNHWSNILLRPARTRWLSSSQQLGSKSRFFLHENTLIYIEIVELFCD